MINLLFCGNEGVFDGVLTCMLSIFKRTETKEPFKVHIFTMDLTYLKANYTPVTEKHRAFLENIAKQYNSENEVVLFDVTDLYKEHFSGCPNETAYCSPYTLIRLLADLIPGLPDKMLYLDTDIMFNRDIRLIYDIDVSGYEYAAGRDHYGKYLIQPNYINAGVLLFNMKRMRETGIFEKARDWLKKKKLVFADQSALIRSTTKKKMLPQRFNDQKFLHKHTVIRHFSKRLFWLPYPHTDNIKQYHVTKVHKVFRYFVFDDILFEYIYLKKLFEDQKDA